MFVDLANVVTYFHFRRFSYMFQLSSSIPAQCIHFILTLSPPPPPPPNNHHVHCSATHVQSAISTTKCRHCSSQCRRVATTTTIPTVATISTMATNATTATNVATGTTAIPHIPTADVIYSTTSDSNSNNNYYN